LAVAALGEAGGAGDLLRGAPGAVLLADDDRLAVAGASRVGPARAAVARRPARQRIDHGESALVERRRAGDFPSGAPGAVRLVDDPHLLVQVARLVMVVAARAAVTRRPARHRIDRGDPPRVEGRQAGNLLGGAPGAVLLAGAPPRSLFSPCPTTPGGAPTPQKKTPPPLQFPAEAHDTESIPALLPALRVARPGTFWAVPQVPFFSLTTNGCPWPGPVA